MDWYGKKIKNKIIKKQHVKIDKSEPSQDDTDQPLLLASKLIPISPLHSIFVATRYIGSCRSFDSIS